ncbi:MAG: hypothetical protein HYX35_07025 [Proteobacteria bacterium]|nr:hypothetical protein [Pseudomonadota bacterium]
MTSDTMPRLTYFFPWSLVVALLVAVVFAIIGILIYKSATKKEEEEHPQEKHHPLLEKCKTYLARFGIFPADPLTQSFSYALKMMRTFVGGTQSQYQLPWVLMLGGSNAGKSSIVQNLDLDRPIDQPHFEGEGGDKPLCDWYFYDHGIVLDLDGKLVLNAAHAISDESKWQLFLNLLAHYRPKRPLDGIVLTIPASELIGKTALSHDDILIRADYLYNKLWQIQRLTGLRIPIYIVVAKCDLVPGFESFCKSIPAHNKSDIFGWSNDKAIESIYETAWIDEAFSSINESLYRAQEEIYADGKTIDNRDGVFLFPLAFNQLKTEVRTYTDHLFKPSSYHESFFLRGIYFVGDSHLDEPNLPPSASLQMPWHFQQKEKDENRNLYFANDLFENKVFREVGLARPVSRVLLGNTTVIRFAKILVSAAAIIGTLGLLRANEKLQNAKTNLMSVLPQIDTTLAKIQGQTEGTNIGRLYFDQQAQSLLDTMTQIDVNTLISAFVPPSWFSSLDEEIRDVMVLVYDKVILRSMSSQLNYKAQQLVSLNTPVPVTTPPGNGLDPLETTEFYRLRNYVISLQALELAARKFNLLGQTSNLQDVADIIKYLFNYKMPEDFFKNDYYYLYALKNTNVKMFDFDEYQTDASTKLSKLFDEFQLAVFNPNLMIPGLSQLATTLYEFSGARNYTAYDTVMLRGIFTSLQTTINSILNPELQWLDADYFDPGAQYEYVIKLILGSSFFTQDIGTDLTTKIDQDFKNFRLRLAGYSSPLFDGKYLFVLEGGLAISEPSQGAILLENNLNAFFKEAFMAPTSNKTIITAIPIGSVLLWDTLRLQDAVNLISTYNDFMNSRLLNMPRSLQPLLQKVARESLTQNLVEYIANAEVFSSQIAVGSALSPEDALLSQVQNYRASAPYLEQILFALKANNANTAFGTLKSLLTTQTYTPLKKLDEILTEEYPYAIKMNSFEWWNGQNMAALEAFGVYNLTDLKNYLGLQRERINYLAREFAEPLVDFLEQINKEGMPGNLPIMTKWKGIIDEINDYERKAPGNGLVELEEFIMNPLNEVTLATCAKYASTVSMISANNDFFVSTLVDIQEKLHKQCVALSGYVSVDNYTQVSQFFNANLAGKFPFVKNTDCLSPDADPEDIRTFFEMMDTQVAGIKNTLKQATNLGPAGKNALTFIEQMEQLRSFFGGYLAPTCALPLPAFKFDVTFRTNQNKESHANAILDWSFITNNTVISINSSSHGGTWTAGDPVKVNFRWAANSPLQPVTDKASNVEVQGVNATYSYGGTWALLRLLRQQQDSSNDNPITLRFDIPLTNVFSDRDKNSMGCTPKATVFIRVALSPVSAPQQTKTTPTPSSAAPEAPSEEPAGPPPPPCGGLPSDCPAGGTNNGGQGLTLPYFPYQAPQLNNSGS